MFISGDVKSTLTPNCPILSTRVRRIQYYGISNYIYLPHTYYRVHHDALIFGVVLSLRALSCLFFVYKDTEKPTRSCYYQIVCRECRHDHYWKLEPLYLVIFLTP